MAPRLNIWVLGCAVALALLLCPVSTFRRLSIDQTDEDLTFDDEESIPSRSRRDLEDVDQSSGISKRQSFASLGTSDDENIPEGSGDYGPEVDTVFKTYRAKFLRDEYYNSKYADKTSPEFKDLKSRLEREFEPLFSTVPGNVDLYVVRVGSANNGRQEVLMDITHEGEIFQNEGAKIQRTLEEALSARFMSSIPDSLSFKDVGDRSASRCQPNEELCPEGICVPRCDGVPDCESGADELNCRDIDKSVVDKDPTLPPCTTNEVRCHSGEMCAPKCDGVANCPDGEDEQNCESGVLPEVSLNFPESEAEDLCPPTFNKCDSNRCIEDSKWCDGVQDCRDNEDEVHCPGPTTTTEKITTTTTTPVFTTTELTHVPITPPPCTGDQFKCTVGGSCIPYSYKCNGIPDCEDRSDETSCGGPDCGPEELECDNKCISISTQVCNGIRDCSDGRDETPALCSPHVTECKPDEFRCNDGSCIASFRRCDFIQDCSFNEDEENCMCQSPKNYQCLSGQCVDGTRRCDGVEDCDDGSDEMVGCNDYCEGSGEFVCDDGETCLEMSKQCDGARDCLDGTDEKDCGISIVPTEPSTTTTTGRICPPGEHQCDDGKCIQIDFKCDGKDDCEDKSDELNCTCMPSEWKCNNGECIPLERRCDAFPNCQDSSDEFGCPHACGNNEWQCNDGSCIPKGQRCDHTYQCGDRSDEADCEGCSSDQWQCRDGTCVTYSARCNNVVDCTDSSDEDACPGTACKDDEFGCHDDGTCIPAYLRCDGRPYCRDGSDELNCQRPDCKDNDFRCLDNGFCIPEQLRCDGHKYCYDGSDELDCPTDSPSSCTSPDKFLCGTGVCIDREKLCDGINNCQDRSDEAGCPSFGCHPDQFPCNDGRCLSIDLVCNRQNDCANGEDERNCLCSADEFKCPNGNCIAASKKCDGVTDCPGTAADEVNCTPPKATAAPLCANDEFQCTNGQCIPKRYTCDGFPDCNDGSDENTNACACRPGEWACVNGHCIQSAFRCDGIVHCRDRTDEENCPPRECTDGEFRCGDGSCIDNKWRCDEVSDCIDGSDEVDCDACGPFKFACGRGVCISESLRCDSKNDCQDGSDEHNCQCSSSQFKCRSGECIEQSKVCDLRNDCLDNSDEHNCDTSSVFYSPFTTTSEPPIPTPRCTSFQFQCESYQCIELSKRCNGRFDCLDLTDEVNCPAPQCSSSQFKCDSGECITLSQKCNNVYDCPDASDEHGCVKESPYSNCGSFEFECSSGECVSQAVVCDGRIDCFDRSDEANCGGNSTRRCIADREFTCHDGECISVFAHCDGAFDCRDGSDENDCPQYSRPCSASEFQCGDGQCISSLVRCDGRHDCLDNSDERDCPVYAPPTTPPPRSTSPPQRRCELYEFKCVSGDCIAADYRCDGKYDCRDYSDEANCPVLSPITPATPPQRPSCGYNEFTCRSGQCIDSSRECDRTYDCIDKSDEENCLHDSFICYNGQRIPNNLRCDGRSDCHDGTDERECPGTCQEEEFQCLTGGLCISNELKCDGSFDCLDRSDEAECGPVQPYPPTHPTDSLNIKTYPEDQTIKQSREVVFQCRDEGATRRPVHWIRSGGQRLPPGSSDIRGRLTMPNIQLEHAGTYYCEAQGVNPNTPGSRKSVNLVVLPFQLPTPPPFLPDCSSTQATCRNGECIPKNAVCDGDRDCSDGSDESRCSHTGCEPNEFQCDNSQCVGKAWICDADDDCGDGSDERNCDGPSSPGSNCTNFEFTCQTGEQCIPKSFHCDNEIDCQDGSDEFGCSKPTIIEPPPRTISIDIGETFTITCKAVGVPLPIIVWRLNWGHVPQSCTMTSERGYGVLTCVSAQPDHQGAYSCEAINSLGSVFAEPDAIVQVKSSDSVCSPPLFNAGAITTQDCLNCFCFGATDQCHSTDRFVAQLPPPTSETFQIIGVNQDQFQGNFVIRDSEYVLSPRYLRPFTSTASVQLDVRDRNRLGGPSDLLIYFSLPESHKGTHLTAFGGYIRYNIQFSSSVGGQIIRGPDVILRGNNITIMHVHDYTFEPGRRNQIDVRLWAGNWYKRVIRIGGRVQSLEPASRRDILTALQNLDQFLIRASYTDGSNIDTTLSDVQLDTALLRQSNQGRAVFVEECRCPPGYSGMSCEECAPNYRRTYEGPYLGRCVIDVTCGPGEYGDPANGIPCLACPCPLTNPANQFSQSCFLDGDGQVTCNCQRGYKGRRCESCADGYEGNPTIPGDSCQPAGECDGQGSLSSEPDPVTGLCNCKDYAVGPKCSQCQEGSFYLNENNQYGCIKCFCMGITDTCTSSNWYRTEEIINFVGHTQGVQLVDLPQDNIINSNLFTDTGTQELIFRTFADLPSGTYYWKLPQRFLGDKVTAYGGNLVYTLRYVPTPGGQSSPSNACDVEIYGNDVTLRYFSKKQVSSNSLETFSVPFYEQYWQRQDGQTANREHFLMALADLEYILIKATYTTITQEVGLKEVRLATAVSRNTGLERAYAVEMCDCPEGYRGLSCEDCNVGYTRGLSGLHLGTCELCNCNGYSNDCDPETGVCLNCRENKAGDFCEKCADGYYESYSGKCERVEPCTCDSRGSISTQCYNDQCQCRENVEGDECNTCKTGHFYLSEKISDGCLQCWCNGVTNRCSSSQFYREQIPMNLFPGHGFTLADRLRTNVISDNLEVSIPENKISFSRFDLLSSQNTTYYWSLPQIYTGNRLTSYGGQLSITQSFISRSATDIYIDVDVIITSADKREFNWMNPEALKPQRTQNYTVVLVESEFTVEQRPATRAEFLTALANVEAILIRAQFSKSMVLSSLQYVTMDTAVDYQTGQGRAFDVEQCSCPSEYIGFSCEECSQGFYRDSRTNRCLRCPCNGKEESCVEAPNGEIACVCLPGFTGPNCGVSAGEQLPFSGVLEITISQPYYETEVGATIELVCSVSQGNRISITWDKEGGTLPYGRSSDNRQGILVITQVRPEDAGIYICRASTGVHVSEEKTELFVSGGPPPTKPVVIIEERREEVEVSIGEYFEVRCRASGSPSPQVQWLRADGRPLSPAVIQQNGILTFRNPQTADSGAYICRGRNREGIADATITIYIGDHIRPPAPRPDDFIIVQVSKEEIEARPGEVVRVTCTVPNTVFRATITWTREQGELPQQASQRDGELIIPDARPIDSGLYTCRVADNQGRTGEATTRVNIVFYGNLPEVRIEPDRQTINQGTSAQLRCIATGNPQPTISWTKVNEEFGSNVVIEGNLLRVENAVINDRGMYVCEAVNDVGRARTAAILEVERREPPVIEMYPDTRQTIERGSSAMFQCHLTGGIPPPTVTWARSDGRSLTPNTVTLTGGVLRFNQVSGEEEGSYICTAVNDAGKMTATATLEVQAIPVITLRPGSSPLRFQTGDKIRLECSSEGDPLPSVTWQKLHVNYEQDIPGRSLAPARSVYEVASATLTDQGTYQCTATNAVGSSVERIQVLVQDNLPVYPPTVFEHTPAPPAPPSRPEENVEAYQIPLGGDFQFRCFAEGSEEDLLFTFRRTDGRPLPRNYVTTNGVLSVSDIGRDAEGEYACIVRSRTTDTILVTIYATLEVVEQPRVRLEPARQVVRPGDTVSLRCIVTGAQPITINWSKETGPMPPSVIINGGELLFRGIATTDTGRYICEAINNVGRATSVAEVIVNERPLLTALQDQITLFQGQDIDLRCEPSGINPASVQWSFEGRSLPPNAHSLPSEAVLRITHARPENSGRYKCEAVTSFGGQAFDYITVDVRSPQAVDIRIRAIPENVRLGDPVELYCDVIGQQRAVVAWSREGGPLPYNARAEGRTLRIANVQPNNGGIYKCTVTVSSGVYEESYPLAIQNIPTSDEITYGHGSRSVETRSTQFGSTVVMKCGIELAPPVSFTWFKQGGQLPIRARINDDVIEIPEVQADDAGTYICTGRNDIESVDVPTLLIVTGVVPRFSGKSYLALPTLPDAYLVFDLEISFNPKSNNGLILYNSQREGPGDFISFGLNDGFAEFRFDVGSGPAVLRSAEQLSLNEWHTVKLSRNRKEGTMIVNNGMPVTGKSEGRFQGLDLINPLFIGGVPDFAQLNDQAGFSSGFEGCVSRLVIGVVISELMRDARSQNEVSPCDTCSANPCQNAGVCQEAYSAKGHKCICAAGFSGDSCESTGESCYPGVCGSGKCVNIPGGLECYCPFGKTGPRCEQSITISEPAFARGAYMAYPTPRALKRFSLGMNVKPESLDDGLIMYCGQQERGDGDFTSLALRNKKLEFKFNTGTGTAILMSDEIVPGEWINVNANRTDKVGSLQVNGGPMQNAQSPGSSRSLNLRTPLFIGGVDKSKIEVAPEVQVSDGFTGCISDIKLMDQPINIEDSLVDSSNVDQCGVSPCSRNHCLNGGICSVDPHSPLRFICECLSGYHGPTCDSQEGGICLNAEPCFNGGVCQEVSSTQNQCLCPLGYAGRNCERESFLSDAASFSGTSWLEVDRYLLPQDGISDQDVTIEFSTVQPNGLLLWLGQDPSLPGENKDYLSVGVVNGYLEFTFHMDKEVVSVTSEIPVDDGERHLAIIKRSKNKAQLSLDDLPEVHQEGSGNLFSFNTLGNIYIGGTPDLHRMTGSKYGVGFSGCIHRLKIGINEIENFMDFALKGVNVTPCPSSFYEMKSRNFVEYAYPPSVIKHTAITTKRKTVTTRKVYHG